MLFKVLQSEDYYTERFLCKIKNPFKNVRAITRILSSYLDMMPGWYFPYSYLC